VIKTIYGIIKEENYSRLQMLAVLWSRWLKVLVMGIS